MSVRRAVPVHSVPDQDGRYALPLFDEVARKVTPGDWARIDLPAPTGIALQEGDLLRFTGRHRPQGIGYVLDTGAGTQLKWLSGGGQETETVDTDALEHSLEHGCVEKVSSGLSLEEAEYLLGTRTCSQRAQATPPLASEQHEAKGDNAEAVAAPDGGIAVQNRSGPGESRRLLSVDSLTFTREYSKVAVQKFLNHPDVGHTLGGNIGGLRAMFGARDRASNDLVAVCVLTMPSAPNLDGERVIELKRFASHSDRPANTGSWLISRTRDWMQLEGYERCRTYAGVAGNEGTLYESLPFEHVADCAADQHQGWANRDNRTASHGRDAVFEDSLLPPVAGIHRRRGAATDDEQTSLSAFQAEHPAVLPSDTAAEARLSGADADLVFGRRDNNPDSVRMVLDEYGMQVPGQPDEIDFSRFETAAFCALSPNGIAAALVGEKPASDDRFEFNDYRITGYAARGGKYPHNIAAGLLTRLKRWAALEGYKRVVCRCRPDTPLESGLKQSAFSRTDANTWTVSLV